MFCPNCGANNQEGVGTCQSCQAVFFNGHEYTGYWRRYGAYALDFAILYIVVLIGIVLVAIIGAVTFSFDNGVASILGLLLFLVILVVVLLYYPLFESSKMQATPGKIAVGAIVTDMNGNRISFGRALVRFFSKIISVLLLGIGVFMIGFTEKRQGLHDMIAGTLVVTKEPVYFVNTKDDRTLKFQQASKRSTTTTILIVGAAGVGAIIFLVIFAAVISAFVFQLGSNVPEAKSVGVEVARVNPNSIYVKTIGGADVSSMTGITVSANGVIVAPSSGRVTSKIGSIAYYNVKANSQVTVIAEFNDNTEQVVWTGTII